MIPLDAMPIVIGIVLAFTLIIISLYIYSINKRLNQKIQQLNIALRDLAKSEERYRIIAENTTDVIWTMDLQGRFTYVSPSVERLRGYTVEEVMSQPADQALTEQSRHHYIEGMKRIQEIVRQGGRLENETFELEQTCKDGFTVWTEAIINGIYDAQGKLTGIIGVTRDIAKRRDAEIWLRILSTAVEQLPKGIVIADRMGHIKYANNIFLQRTGMTRENLSILNYRFLINSMGTAINIKAWEDIEAGKSWTTERPCKDNFGNEYWESIIISPVRDAAGNISHFISTHRDISDKKALESQVKDLLHTIETIGDNLPKAFIYQMVKTYPEIERRFTYISKGISDIVGIEPEVALQDANKIFERLHPEDMVLFLNIEKETIEERREGLMLDLRGYDIFGVLKWVRVQASYMFNDDGRTITINGIITDITRYKALEMELEAARQEALIASMAKGEFLANMSHEIRTPLHSIIGYTELLKDMPLPREAKDYIENMKNAEAALLCLINDILDFSKIESGKMTLFTEEIDLITFLEQTLDTISLQAYQKGLELICDIDPMVPRFIHADAVRLRRVLINFLSNAVKFTEEGEIALKVRFEEIDDSRGIFYFAVRDTGIGIGEEHQKHIFDSFVQIDSTTTRKYAGTGLGLAISERLVKLMGGHIKLVSRPLEGSEFSFSIETMYKRGISAIVHLPASLKALVIYRNDTTLRYIKELLTLCGINTMECSSDNDARDLAVSHPDIDLLLVEYKIFSDIGLNSLREIIFNLQKTHPDLRIILILDPATIIDSRYTPAWLNNAIRIYKPIKFTRLYEILQAPKRDGNEIAYSAFKLTEKIANEAPIKILVAEDVPMNMVIIEKLITKIAPNAHIFKASNGREAIEAYMSNFPDIVLMDVQMPEVNGLSATRVIREKEAVLQRRSIIVALTAGNTDTERQSCMGAGMDHFLSKPIDMRALKEMFINFQ